MLLDSSEAGDVVLDFERRIGNYALSIRVSGLAKIPLLRTVLMKRPILIHVRFDGTGGP